MSFRESDKAYYKNYYSDKKEIAYVGEQYKDASRMLVFSEWLRAELKPGARVLDIGCGDAIFAELMPEFEWTGVDINTERATGRIPSDRLVVADLMLPPYALEAASFDAIICSEVLEHLWDLRVVHREAKRLLKREGLYVISTPNFDWLQNHLESYRKIMQDQTNHWAWEHIRHYNVETHQKFLNEVGFVIEKHTGADGHFDPVVANISRVIRERLRALGTDVAECTLHKWCGEAIPHYSHTCIIAARKA